MLSQGSCVTPQGPSRHRTLLGHREDRAPVSLWETPAHVWDSRHILAPPPCQGLPFTFGIRVTQPPNRDCEFLGLSLADCLDSFCVLRCTPQPAGTVREPPSLLSHCPSPAHPALRGPSGCLLRTGPAMPVPLRGAGWAYAEEERWAGREGDELPCHPVGIPGTPLLQVP